MENHANTSFAIIAILTTALPILSAPASAQAAPTESPVCSKLMSDYEMVSKKLAFESVVNDKSDNGALDEAKMAFEIMKSNGCKLPTSLPSSKSYILPAMDCKIALQKRELSYAQDRFSQTSTIRPYPDECILRDWKAR